MTIRTAAGDAGAGIEAALAAAEERYREVTARLASPGVLADPAELRRLSTMHAELEPLMDAGGRYRQLGERLAEAIEMESDPDPEVAELAAEEAAGTRAELELVTGEIRRRLLPRDPNDDRNVLLEVRAGTGGEEAALFAREVFRMYEQYARSNGFRVDVVSSQESPVGGIKEIVSVIEGKGAFNRLKFESGVHRVQRVPATEASGRIHTSAVTVAVLPEAEDVEIQIDPKDLRVDTFLLLRPRRPEREHHLFGGAHHPPSLRAGGELPGREIADQEQGEGAARPQIPTARSGPAGAAGAGGRGAARTGGPRRPERKDPGPTTSRRTGSPTTGSRSPSTPSRTSWGESSTR